MVLEFREIVAPSHLGLGALESAAIDDPTVRLAKISTSRNNGDEKDGG